MTLKNYLTILGINAAIFFVLVFTWHFSLYTISYPDFIFITLLVFGCGFYRPQWVFALALTLLPLETLSLLPPEAPLTLRPTLLLGCAALLGYVLKSGFTNSFSRILRINGADFAVIAIFVGTLLGLLIDQDRTDQGRYLLILAMLLTTYIMTKLFFYHTQARTLAWGSVAVSGILVAGYGVTQNILFNAGLIHKQAMPGRPNGTFAEADWLGIFLILPLIVVSAWLFIRKPKILDSLSQALVNTLLTIALFLIQITLVLTVARSAWIGALVGVSALSCLIWRMRGLQQVLISLVGQGSIAVLALILINGLSLSTFNLEQRLQSTAGLQEITIACEASSSCTSTFSCPIPITITDITELEPYNCTFIDLEEISSKEDEGLIVTTTKRPDPTVSVRQEIYQTSLQEIKNNPFLGIGWGMVGQKLGEDEHGNTHNSANLAVQLIISIGVFGIGAILLLTAMSIVIFARFMRHTPSANPEEGDVIIATTLSSATGIFAANMFNAGLLQHYMWFILGLFFTSYLITQNYVTNLEKK